MLISDIIPYERNARRNEKAVPAVAESIKAFGFKGAIVLRSHDDPTIVCDESNLAYKALEEMRKAFDVKESFKIFIYKKIPVEAGLGGGPLHLGQGLHRAGEAVGQFDLIGLHASFPPFQNLRRGGGEHLRRGGKGPPLLLRHGQPGGHMGPGAVHVPDNRGLHITRW